MYAPFVPQVQGRVEKESERAKRKCNILLDICFGRFWVVNFDESVAGIVL